MATEKTGTGVNFSKLVFVATNGVPDVDKTLDAIRVEMVAYLAENVPNMPAIAEAVASVFARMPEAENKQKVFTELALQALGSMTVEIGKETKTLETIKEYIRNENRIFKATNGEDGKYLIVSGSGGGVRLSTPSTIATYRATQAKKNSVVVDL
jgi:hypothetical protein